MNRDWSAFKDNVFPVAFNLHTEINLKFKSAISLYNKIKILFSQYIHKNILNLYLIICLLCVNSLKLEIIITNTFYILEADILSYPKQYCNQVSPNPNGTCQCGCIFCSSSRAEIIIVSCFL